MKRIAIASSTIIIALLLVPTISARSAPTRQLTFEDRVRAQEAIERVYYSHQIGATKPFDEAVPQSAMEEKVHTYLKQSVALGEFWDTPVTREMLQSEIERMSRATRMPGRLVELYAALNDDPVLILECLSRPALVDRLARSFFAADQRIHGNTRFEADTLREQLLEGQLDSSTPDPRRTVVEIVRDDGQTDPSTINAAETDGSSTITYQEVPSEQFDEWVAGLPPDPGLIGDIKEGRSGFQMWIVLESETDRVRALNYLIEKRSWDSWWSAEESAIDSANVATIASDADSVPAPDLSGSTLRNESNAAQLATCIPDDTWDNGVLDDLPIPRESHTVVWTGNLMIVWGGYDYETNGKLGSGGRYNPATDSWSPTSNINAPSSRYRHTAVWTGTLMVIWGGLSPTGTTLVNTGGRYDPASDTWTPTSTIDAPLGRQFHTAVWTGNVMIVWGGETLGIQLLNTGGLYNPATNSWISTSTTNAPVARRGHTSIWTGTQMIVWGGGNASALQNSGGRYDPIIDTWTTITGINAPSERADHTTIWTGSLMIVWGGIYSSVYPYYTSTGGRYDPDTDTWTATSNTNTPMARHLHTAVWTGSRMIVWGGEINGFVDTGGQYDPAADAWAETSTVNSPSARGLHSAIWTGSHMVVWGGEVNDLIDTNTGGRYDSATNSWTPTSTTNAPSGRWGHTAIWTGSLMIVWGGFSVSYPNDEGTGGRYDPATDTWTPTSMGHALGARFNHSAIWTGSRMIVWGGETNDGRVGGGSRYDPISDAWTPVSMVNAPIARGGHGAVWTGDLMVIWGGNGFNTGGRYDPSTDTWSPTSTLNAPTSRVLHSTIWTGSRMIVWGGTTVSSNAGIRSGAQYDPSADTWSPTSLTNAPSGRGGHSAIWTGDVMIVWGGVSNFTQYVNTGGRYNPTTDSWTATSTSSAPSARTAPAVWTGSRMIVWGGGLGVSSGTGARYNPATDSWAPTSTVNAPSGRNSHTAIWTGNLMIIWGGSSQTTPHTFDTGGRYALTLNDDNDGDGFSECAGDCNDADAGVHPGVAERCDNVDNNCDGNVDGFATSCGVGACGSTGTCVNGTDTCASGQLVPESCDAIDNDCNGVTDDGIQPVPTSCGVGACAGIGETTCVGGVLGDSCRPGQPVAETCNGLDDDCDAATDEGLGPGTVEIDLDQITLWPPNHRMVDLHASVTVGGGCPAACATPPTVALMSATSNEPDDANGVGDGQTVNDVQDATLGSADFDLKLRAERDGTRNGRLYELVYAVTDCFGDTSVGSDGVFVPREEGGQTEPVILEVVPREGGGTGSYVLQWSPVADATAYNVLRGRISKIRAVGSLTVVEDPECVASGLTATSVSGGVFDENPVAGEAFFFLTEYVNGLPSGYGTESGGRELVIGTGDSCH